MSTSNTIHYYKKIPFQENDREDIMLDNVIWSLMYNNEKIIDCQYSCLYAFSVQMLPTCIGENLYKTVF